MSLNISHIRPWLSWKGRRAVHKVNVVYEKRALDPADRPEVEIRQLSPGDEDLFDHVADGVFDHGFDKGVLVAYLNSPGHHLIVAMHDGEIIGQVAGVVHRHPDLRPTEMYIDEVAVADQFLRQGIARRMLDAMFDLAKSLGCVDAWVGTELDNVAADALYTSAGSQSGMFRMYVFKL